MHSRCPPNRLRSLAWRWQAAVLPVAIALFLSALAAQPPAARREAHFKDRIAPLLKSRCLECHNPQRSRGGLDLSSRSAFLEGGATGPAVVPGKPGDSLLYKLVQGGKMPRKGKALAELQLRDIKQWIDDGASWSDNVSLVDKNDRKMDSWWAFQPLVRTLLPKIKDTAWPRNEIDHFVLAMLESKGLTPAPPVDRAGFIRRATFDLHGLPPTPAEIDAFVNDMSPDAFEKLIDRLLASPRYGERWGRHWLDIVHYADTHGFDKDKRRLWAWLFRDWVIRALNQDMPYRRFVRYQLAGDACFPEDPDGIIATGFVVAGPWDFVGHVELREGTVEKDKTRSLDRDDMLANTMSTFTSMTVHCARCHDHKFDPIPQKDYYRLQAVFAGVERGDREVGTPEVLARRTRLQQQRTVLTERRANLLKELAASPEYRAQDRRVKKLQQWLDRTAKPSPRPSPSNGYHSAIEAKPEVAKWVQVDLGKSLPLDYIRLLPARPTDFPDTPGFGFPPRFRVLLSDEPTFARSTTILDRSDGGFPNPGDQPVTLAADGKKARYLRVAADRLWLRTNDYIFALAELQAFSGGTNVALGKPVTSLDSIEAGRWSRKYLVDHFDSRHQLAVIAEPEGKQRLETEAALGQEQDRLQRLLASNEGSQLKGIDDELSRLGKELESPKDSARAYAVVPQPPRPIHLLQRGDVLRKGALAKPGALSLLPGIDPVFAIKNVDQEGERRAALADWIVDSRNVLTWRSIVNRVWQYHFGRGIVDTPSDFGKNGSRPSHPELLDWLAVEFRDGGQSFKKLHRLILTSAAYRQSSRHEPEHAKIDADNRYLWRMNRQRLDAESIRDSMLAVSGQLRDAMHGPGFELFRFKDDHSPIYDHLALEHINDPKNWRRTVYRFVVRSVPNPFLDSLDCADPNINVPVRNTTLTALQALALLNNPFVVKQAEHCAERVRTSGGELSQQIELAYRLAFGRPPRNGERDLLAGYARRHGLANACRVLLNANEFVFVD